MPFSEKDTLIAFKQYEHSSTEYPASNELRQSKSSPHFDSTANEADYNGLNSRNKLMMSTPRGFREEYDFELSGVYDHNETSEKQADRKA